MCCGCVDEAVAVCDMPLVLMLSWHAGSGSVTVLGLVSVSIQQPTIKPWFDLPWYFYTTAVGDATAAAAAASVQATTGGLLQGLSDDALAVQQALSDKVSRALGAASR